MSWDRFCELYLDTSEDRDSLLQRIAGLIGGAVRHGSVSGRALEVDVRRNDSRDPARAQDPDNGFLFFPLILDIVAAEGVAREEYALAVDELLKALARPGVRFVTAAEDEPSLWNGGRWDGTRSSDAGLS